MRSFILSCLLAVLAVCCLAVPSRAAMVPMTTSTLTTESETVIIGKVMEVKSSWDLDHKTIVTRASIKVKEVVRGSVESDQVEVEYEGGIADHKMLMVADSPKFETGDMVLVFLKPATSALGGYAYEVAGLAQGVYTIGEDGIANKGGYTVVKKRTMGLATADGGQAAGDGMDNDIPVGDLVEKIKAVK